MTNLERSCIRGLAHALSSNHHHPLHPQQPQRALFALFGRLNHPVDDQLSVVLAPRCLCLFREHPSVPLVQGDFVRCLLGRFSGQVNRKPYGEGNQPLCESTRNHDLQHTLAPEGPCTERLIDAVLGHVYSRSLAVTWV